MYWCRIISVKLNRLSTPLSLVLLCFTDTSQQNPKYSDTGHITSSAQQNFATLIY